MSRIQLDDLIGDLEDYAPQLLRLPNTKPLPKTDAEMIHAAANTAKHILKQQGVTNIEVSDSDAANAQDVFMQYVNHTPIKHMPDKPEAILKLEALVSTYDYRVIQHADQIRFLVTNKLLELSDHKDPKIQIKAVELLGKLADVGMFVEKQEITLKQTSDAELKQKLQEKLGLLIEGEIINDRIETPETATIIRAEEKAQKQNAKEHQLLTEEGVIPLPETPKISAADMLASI